MKTRVIRVCGELSNELNQMAQKNDMKVVDVSKEVAKMLRQQKMSKSKIIREIKF